MQDEPLNYFVMLARWIRKVGEVGNSVGPKVFYTLQMKPFEVMNKMLAILIARNPGSSNEFAHSVHKLVHCTSGCAHEYIHRHIRSIFGILFREKRCSARRLKMLSIKKPSQTQLPVITIHVHLVRLLFDVLTAA